VARELGADPTVYVPHTWDRPWLENRRQIQSFFVRELDRDRIVLPHSGAQEPTLEKRACDLEALSSFGYELLGPRAHGSPNTSAGVAGQLRLVSESSDRSEPTLCRPLLSVKPLPR
jgi:hypothetical protein